MNEDKLSTNELVSRKEAVLKAGGKELWHRFFTAAVMDRLPQYPSLHDELIRDLRSRVEMTDDLISKAALEEALRQLKAL